MCANKTLAIFCTFFGVARIFPKKNVYELNFATFSAICTFEILLNALVSFVDKQNQKHNLMIYFLCYKIMST